VKDLTKKNCALCDYFKILQNPYLDRFFNHYCTCGGKEKFLGDDNFSSRQNVCGKFLKKIKLDGWSCYPWKVIKVGGKNAVIWKNRTEEAEVLSREDASVFCRKKEARDEKGD
jgi:hypothetical protein